MSTQQVHRLSTIALIALSLAAALTVLLAVAIVVLSGQAPQPAHDEGTAARIFQLTVVAAALSAMVFLSTAEWRDPSRVAGPLVAAAGLLAIAFSVLYYFERVLGY